jgi:predicted aspartyl protease
VRLALDTGAVKTLIPPDVLDDIGYNARDGEGITIIRTANDAPEPGYTLRVQYLFALGFGFSDFQVHAHDMPDYGIEGLLGMSFLEHFNFTVRPIDQEIYLEPARPPIAA